MKSGDYIMRDYEDLIDALAYDFSFFGCDEIRIWCTTESQYFNYIHDMIDNGMIKLTHTKPEVFYNNSHIRYNEGVLLDLRITEPTKMLLEFTLL